MRGQQNIKLFILCFVRHHSSVPSQSIEQQQPATRWQTLLKRGKYGNIANPSSHILYVSRYSYKKPLNFPDSNHSWITTTDFSKNPPHKTSWISVRMESSLSTQTDGSTVRANIIAEGHKKVSFIRSRVDQNTGPVAQLLFTRTRSHGPYVTQCTLDRHNVTVSPCLPCLQPHPHTQTSAPLHIPGLRLLI